MKNNLRFSNEDTAVFCSEMNYLLHAGVGNADALTILAEDEARPAYREVLQSMAAGADEGKDLSRLVSESGCFSAHVGEMLAVGEESGRTEEALSALSASSESSAALDRRLRSALMYPSLLLLVMLAVIAVLLIYVLPIFNRVYAQLGSGLNGVAGGLLGVGRALGSVSPLLIVLFCLVVVFLALFSAVPAFRAKILAAWQRSRGDKGLSGKINLARFAQALSLGMSSGLPAEEAIEAAARLLSGSEEAQKRCAQCVDRLNEGVSLSKALKESELLPASQCRLLEAGVRGGSGEQAMEQIARRMTDESEAAIEEAVGKVEPTIVIVTSVLVGLILLAVMLPLINIMSALG